MAKLTLLEMVQDILNDIDSDEVNSINDTQEAQQIAQVIKTTYFNLVEGKDYPHLFELFQMDSSGTVAKPTYMKLPDTIEKISWIKYNTRNSTDTKDKFTELVYKTPDEFLYLTDQRDSSASNVTTIVDDSGVKIYVLNDTPPTYYTSFDDTYLVFDAHDSVVDATLQNSKTKCYGKRIPTFTISDSFYPDLPSQMFSLLLSEAKSTCFINYKQTANQKAEQHSISQRRRMSQEAWRVKRGITYPSYGRK